MVGPNLKKRRLTRFPKPQASTGFDRGFFLLTCFLTLLGFVAVADASAPGAQNYFGDSLFYVKQQLVWGAVGFVALVFAANFPYKYWKKLAIPLFAVNILLLIIVVLPGFGEKILGAKRWISIGPIVLQPSELVKFSLAVFMAALIDKKRKIIAYIIPIVLVVGLIMLQPDLGTSIVVLVIGFVQMFVGGISLLPFLGMGAVGGVMGAILILFSSYRRQRFLTFIQTSEDPLHSSYHIRQVLIALGSGGSFGVGLGQGRQKYLFLPEAATDSVFAVIAEEVGFVGAIFLIGLLCLFIYRGIRIAQRAPDEFGTILGTGIVAWLAAQTFLNIGSMVALVPLTGVPLPFFSYGGSSLTMVLLGVGILLNISKSKKHD
jgi:cell division protein FtsW